MSLTFEQNENPVAELLDTGGEINFIYLEKKSRKKTFDDLPEDELEMAVSAIERGADVEKVYEMLSIGRTDTFREYEDEEKDFMFLPKGQECVYIAAMAGLGKSHVAKEYARRYRYMFEENRIILISTHEEDTTYDDGVEIDQYMADEELMSQDLSPSSLENSLVIFDDVDNILEKNVDKFIQSVVSILLTQGRKYNISVLYLGHQIMNYSKTRTVLNEANKIVLFPANNIAANESVMKRYCGFKKDMIDRVTRLKDMGSRWVCINRSSIPSYVVHEHGVFLV